VSRERAVRRNEPWGSPATGLPEREVTGGDADLAGVVVPGAPAPLVWFRPGDEADLARAVGLAALPEPGPTELALDALLVRTEPPTSPSVAINAVVVGEAPDRTRLARRRRSVHVAVNDRAVWSGVATGVLVANGQFLRGADVVPRGHPGDGRLEVQVYALRPGERRAMRRRLRNGIHVPHPRILERGGRRVEIVACGPRPLEIDGVQVGSVTTVRVDVLPGAVRILV
jgi:hypothetical protein